MKKLSFIIGLAALCWCCQPKERVIENPKYGAKASQGLEIRKIVMNDTATILFAEGYGQPHNWIRVDSGMFLREGNKKYQILKTMGIPLNKQYVLPDSGKCVFQMFFPPIDRSTEQMDLIEGKCNLGGMAHLRYPVAGKCCLAQDIASAGNSRSAGCTGYYVARSGLVSR